jgi:hypothetical protein
MSVSSETKLNDSMESFAAADVLIAADVIYDATAIDGLIEVVKLFLLESPTTKQAIFAITKRNLVSFGVFLDRLETNNISYVWLTDNHDCEALPQIFNCNFTQSRADVRICRLAIMLS